MAGYGVANPALRADHLPHKVPAGSLSAGVRITGLLESRQKAAKAVARRVRIDGIAFDQGRSPFVAA